ncbi:MAG: glycosyl hydrolase family 79 C-terminal domain-containing protein [Terracidiphilus sp.]
MFNRRSFLARAGKASAGLALCQAIRGWGRTGKPISIRLTHANPLAQVPANFIGLGYEKSSAAVTGLLSVTNKRYVQLLRNLGGKGVLRIGGIVADFSRYEPQGRSVAEPKNTVVTRANLEQFCDFLKETGWTAIWSLNFGQGSLDDAIREAKDVAAILGSHLEAIELGNEVENYGKGIKPLRVPPYSYETYRAEYQAWRQAIAKACAGVRFAAPDTASSVEWVERMAKDANGEVQLLTTHYYRGGQKQGSAEQLTYPDPDLRAKLQRLASVSHGSGLPWRICETNSFSGGGLPGVSDTLLGALWTLDYMLLLARYGCSGVNIETGVNQLGFVSSYSPIQDDGAGINTAGAPYYGMLAFVAALAGSPQVLPAEFDPQGINLTCYVCGANEKPRTVVVINRDRSQDADLSIAELGMENVTASRLLTPSPDSKSEISFGGATVDAEGEWKPRIADPVHHARVTVPRMSAAVLGLRQ